MKKTIEKNIKKTKTPPFSREIDMPFAKSTNDIIFKTNFKSTHTVYKNICLTYENPIKTFFEFHFGKILKKKNTFIKEFSPQKIM